MCLRLRGRWCEGRCPTCGAGCQPARVFCESVLHQGLSLPRAGKLPAPQKGRWRL
jgi:hypothetical protein